MKTVKALIKFPSGLECKCLGGVKDGETVPYTKEQWEAHIKKLQDKGYEVSIIRFIED